MDGPCLTRTSDVVIYVSVSDTGVPPTETPPLFEDGVFGYNTDPSRARDLRVTRNGPTVRKGPTVRTSTGRTLLQE